MDAQHPLVDALPAETAPATSVGPPARSIGDLFRTDEPATRMPIYNSKTGKLLKEIPVLGMARVSRVRFKALCEEGIEVRYGKTLVDIEYTDDGNVVAYFEDGETAMGSLVIGQMARDRS
jgi:hypothetical protein